MDDSDHRREEKKWKESLTSDDTIGQYEVERLIAFGGFGCVRLCKTPSKKRVAVKTFIRERMKEKDDENLQRELYVLQHASHPSIIQMHEIIQDSQCVHIVLEYASGGDLFTQIKRHGPVGEPEASRLFMQLVLAVEYLHDILKVCHRDIKLENLLFTDLRTRNIKLIDFNLSSTFLGPKCMVNNARGTPAYSAPEVIWCMEASGLSDEHHIVIDDDDDDDGEEQKENSHNTSGVSRPVNGDKTNDSREEAEMKIKRENGDDVGNHSRKELNSHAMVEVVRESFSQNTCGGDSASEKGKKRSCSPLSSSVPSSSSQTNGDCTHNKGCKLFTRKLKPAPSERPEGVSEDNLLWYDACPADVWSCGVVLFVLIYGYLPFYEHSIRELGTSIKRGLPQKLPSSASPNVRSLLLRTLDSSVKSRMTITEMKTHPWLRSRFKPPTPEILPESKSSRDAETTSKPLPSPMKLDATSDGKQQPEKLQADESWYHKLHGGELSSTIEEEDGYRSSVVSPNSSRAGDWHQKQHITGISGDSWTRAKESGATVGAGDQKKNPASVDEEKNTTIYSEISHDRLLQHIDEEDEEAIEEEDEDGAGWYY